MGGDACTGSLIDENTVVTAAHCYFYDCPGEVTGYVYYGVNRDEPVETRLLALRVVHPEYRSDDPSAPLSANDIALWFLETPFTVVKSFARLASVDRYHGTKVNVAGYGFIDNSGTVVGELQIAQIQIQPNEICEIAHRAYNIRPFEPSVEICAGENGPPPGNGDANLLSDSCRGDSGGPLFVGDILYGTVEIGISRCGGWKGSSYTRVTAFRDWIIREVRQRNGYDFMGDGRGVKEIEEMAGDLIAQKDLHPDM